MVENIVELKIIKSAIESYVERWILEIDSYSADFIKFQQPFFYLCFWLDFCIIVTVDKISWAEYRLHKFRRRPKKLSRSNKRKKQKTYQEEQKSDYPRIVIQVLNQCIDYQFEFRVEFYFQRIDSENFWYFTFVLKTWTKRDETIWFTYF